MAHSTSKHTQTIYLTSGSEGLAADTISNQTFAIQGPTNVTFVLSGINCYIIIEYSGYISI